MAPNSLKDPEREYPPSSLQCGERIEEGFVGSVLFHWKIPLRDATQDNNTKEEPKALAATTPRTRELQVSCRGRSIGVLKQDEATVDDADLNEEQVDVNFFDPGYTLAGRTGFQVWAGSRLCIEALTAPHRDVVVDLAPWQDKMQQGHCRVLELGSGTGVTGLSLAAVGAQVVLTDLPTLVEFSLRPNLELNEDADTATTTTTTTAATTTIQPQSASPPAWMSATNPVAVERGWAGTAVIDWTQPLSSTVLLELAPHVEVIVACDCVWLRSMLDALLTTVDRLFASAATTPPLLLLSFQRRDNAESAPSSGMFTTVPGVVQAVRDRGWSVNCLTWRTVVLDGEVTDKEVFLLEIKKPS